MQIRLSTPEDLSGIMALLDGARSFMIRQGNSAQWPVGYPSQEQILRDIASGHSYVCEEEGLDRLVGTFYFAQEEEPTYQHIEGAWLDETPYGVVHRLASDGRVKGMADRVLAWVSARCTNLRIDTHEANQTMLSFLERNGFTHCGTIYVSDGSPRLAFQKHLA
ncbi:N-acetyltransferase [uncultured Porphyromonas sp.]|uniref:GNAT family N-acetyltransferase n=1 Tax=uncultured Porphyromonas sp. TaxID=159274 RepID=UPI002619874A|nr:N-acetyltransferase [uncultured Porphyromonas sp.]